MLAGIALICATFLLKGTAGQGYYGVLANGTLITEWLSRSTNDPGTVTLAVTFPTTTAPKPWTQPAAAAGESPFVDYYPYDQTATIPYQNFSDISYYQLNVFMNNYNKIEAAAAAASEVPIGDGTKVYLKQCFYTLATWHPEVLATFGISDRELFWTSSGLDSLMATMAGMFYKELVGLYNNDTEACLKEVDQFGYIHHIHNRKTPHAKMTLTTMMNFVDASLAAAKFFLGNAYTDEVDSAFSSVLTFIHGLNWHYMDMYDQMCVKRLTVDDIVTYDTNPADPNQIVIFDP